MRVLNHIILDKNLFEQQLLIYFKNKKNVVFLNSNNGDKTNLFAVSDSDEKNDKEWRFGFISYDYKNQIEDLSSNNLDGIQFPEKHFFTPEILFKIKENEVEIECQNSINGLQEIIEGIEAISIVNHEFHGVNLFNRVSKEDYINNVNHLKKHIQLGDIYEINYCQEYFSQNVQLNPIDIYFKLNEKSPTPFSCFVKYDDKYLLSASPERFIKKSDNKIISQPIKGTIKRGNNKLEDRDLKKQLFNDSKERSENVMIVDLVRNDLSKIAKGNTVKVDELCKIYTFPQVHQMISTITAEVEENIDIENIIKATFPMGSMTGAPKIRAMELIEKYEETRRGLYSGAVGYINEDGDFDFNVVIRSILYNKENNYLSFIVGSAITNKSDPEKEYDECLLKAKAMLEVLSN
ncbi:MAG: aminodeoxychorismate synthase, component I [Flavobacteriales bacterium]|nr:MAG: aminodeoxychorismate synthase, component I [Flavobacteriales bacterium]